MSKSSGLLGHLYVQVLLAVLAGVALGILYPELGAKLQPLGDGFIKLIRMVFSPVIFATIALGIARMESIKDLGRISSKAIIYFEIMSTFALLLGFVVVKVIAPGEGMNVDVATLRSKTFAGYPSGAKFDSIVDFLLNMVPGSIVDSFARNEVLQIVVFSVMFGVALFSMGNRAKPVLDFLESFSQAMFIIVGMVMRVAPLAAFGAMAFTVGQYGLGSIASLAKLVVSMYATCAFFVFVVLGCVARFCGFSGLKFLGYIREEILTVLATASSESVIPQMIRKLEDVGCSKTVVGLVIPSGLTFNPDGQCIYYAMSAIFIAQATNTRLTIGDELLVMAVLMLTSKGSAGVTGAGFMTLAATLASIGKIPVEGMVLLLGVDRFMSEARSITNTIGNAFGTMVVARWVGLLDMNRALLVMDGRAEARSDRQYGNSETDDKLD